MFQLGLLLYSMLFQVPPLGISRAMTSYNRKRIWTKSRGPEQINFLVWVWAKAPLSQWANAETFVKTTIGRLSFERGRVRFDLTWPTTIHTSWILLIKKYYIRIAPPPAAIAKTPWVVWQCVCTRHTSSHLAKPCQNTTPSWNMNQLKDVRDHFNHGNGRMWYLRNSSAGGEEWTEQHLFARNHRKAFWGWLRIPCWGLWSAAFVVWFRCRFNCDVWHIAAKGQKLQTLES